MHESKKELFRDLSGRSAETRAAMSFPIRFWTFVVNVLCLPLHVIHAVGLYSLYKRMIPFVLQRMSVKYNEKMHESKKELFRDLSGFKGNGGQLTILEIGCGTGANFQFYPPGTKVVCTDPNPHFQKYLAENMKKNDRLRYERFVVSTGEDMSSVEDESVDVVVCTLVLCSVTDVAQTLREMHRILRPGGAFFFIEHVVADPSTWTYFFQHVLQPAWDYLGDGCKMTRTTWKYLEEAGFSDLKLQHINAPLFFVIKPHIFGHAVK
ncbi:methyltransferase-like protein 7A [Austrofundulus limnaeus]|uniref:Methyltransferase-like protein 7A n=1 Tax=Austrofundulus limnaeus TaxID=52670 RepID=A0A2I4B9Z3_AUSLI|nr:PREDICTED: methyltransferase-like protein 7A [Austrofundulus limnaeus]